MRCTSVRSAGAPGMSPLALSGSRLFSSGIGVPRYPRLKLRPKNSAPVGERLAVAALGVQDQFLQAMHAAEQLFEKTAERVEIVAIPFGRHFPGEFLQNAGAEIFRATDPGVEGFHSDHAFVDAVARVQGPERRIGVVPLARVEAKNLVDHDGAVAFAFHAGSRRRTRRGTRRGTLP